MKYQMPNLENIYTGNIMQTELAIFINLEVYQYMHIIIIGIRRDHEFERAKRGTWEGLEARWRGGNVVIIV